MYKLSVISFLVVAAVVVVVAAEKNVIDQHLNEAQAIFDWVSGTQDGYITPKLELRRENPNDPKSPMGVYAKKAIEVD